MIATDYDNQLPILVSDIYHHWRKAIDAIAKQYGMTRTQWHIIGKLHCRGPKLSQAVLADMLAINHAQLTRALHQLEDQGIVRRFHEPDNRRSNVVELSNPDADYIQAIDRVNLDMNQRILSSLPQEDQKQLLQWLQHVRSTLSPSLSSA